MPPLFRIDVGKHIFYALDEKERQRTLKRIETDKIGGLVNVQRFKGLGEMNPAQLRETTMDPVTRRLVQLHLEKGSRAEKTIDRLLARKRAADRRTWLSASADQAELS